MATFPQGLTQIDRRCNRGERRVLQQIKRCLEDDYLVWHNVPIGSRARQPDFVVLSPRRGVLLLEVKDWALATLAHADHDKVELNTDQGRVIHGNPLRQARDYAMELVDVLKRDPALIHQEGPFKGHLLFPYGWGVAFSNIRHEQIAGTDFVSVFNAGKTLLRDDLDDAVESAEFQKRLWSMFTVAYPYTLTLPQRDRVRWHLFPDLRMPVQQSLTLAQDSVQANASTLVLPDITQVMDLQQEQIARALGEGHRVIHGAAGSGKTMILVFRAQYLAAAARPEQPVLVLCFNRALAQRIEAMLRERGVDERVQVRTFHSWCQDMVRTYQIALPGAPASGEAYYQALADAVSRAIESGLVPAGQYTALLIDEAHDFEDAWLQMATRMVGPATQSLLVLYDDAQSIYQKKRRKFNFGSVGIAAQGRTSVLKLNYRNTAEVLALAMHCAQSLLEEKAETSEAVQTVRPASAGRRGPMPLLIEAANPALEAQALAEHIARAIDKGVLPRDIAALTRAKHLLAPLGHALKKADIAYQSMAEQTVRDFDWRAPAVKLLTMHSAKGLEFSVTCVMGLQVMPWAGQPLDEEVRLLYVAMTRATQSLLISAAGDSAMVARVKASLEVVNSEFAHVSVDDAGLGVRRDSPGSAVVSASPGDRSAAD